MTIQSNHQTCSVGRVLTAHSNESDTVCLGSCYGADLRFISLESFDHELGGLNHQQRLGCCSRPSGEQQDGWGADTIPMWCAGSGQAKNGTSHSGVDSSKATLAQGRLTRGVKSLTNAG